MQVHRDFNSYLSPDIRQRLNKTLSRIRSFDDADFVSGELFSPSIHLLNRKGKLLRPALIFLGAKALDNHDDFIDLASAVELLHVSSLIHDDIIDMGEVRRGVSSVNAKYGNSAALLAGNALISKAIQLSAKYGDRVLVEVANTVMQMCAGELMDYRANSSRRTSVARALEIARLKTAVLIGASCSIVATYMNSSAKPYLYKCGLNMGMAFQIRDDMLDFSEGSRDGGSVLSGANVVDSIRHAEGVDRKEALRSAAELNHHYVREALRSVEGKRMAGLLKPYAKMMEVVVD